MRHGIFDLGNPPTLDHAREVVRALRASIFPWEKLIPAHRYLGGVRLEWSASIAPAEGVTWPPPSNVQLNPSMPWSNVPWIMPHEVGHRIDQAIFGGGGSTEVSRVMHQRFPPEDYHRQPHATIEEHVTQGGGWWGEDYYLRLSESFAQSFAVAFFPSLGNTEQWYGHSVQSPTAPNAQAFRDVVLAQAAKIRVFSNMAGNPHEPGVEWAAGQGILDWTDEATFWLGQAVSRGYLAAMVNRMAVTRINPPAASPVPVWLTDIGGHQYEAEIKWACGMEIVGGYPNGSFLPNQAVNREQAATFIRKTMALFPEVPPNRVAPTFNDIHSSDPHLPNVIWCAERGILKGKTTANPTQFGPLETMSREAMSTTLQRAAALLG